MKKNDYFHIGIMISAAHMLGGNFVRVGIYFKGKLRLRNFKNIDFLRKK